MTDSAKKTNPLALAMLAQLSEGPRHPYELAAALRARRVQSSVRLNYGSLYTAIDGLRRDGCVRPIATTREGRRPARTVYAITSAGEELMRAWLAELLSVPHKEYPHFAAALAVLPVLAPEAVRPLLEARAHALAVQIAALEDSRPSRATRNRRELLTTAVEYQAHMLRAEQRFIATLIGELNNPSSPTTAVWRQIRVRATAAPPTGGTGGGA